MMDYVQVQTLLREIIDNLVVRGQGILKLFQRIGNNAKAVQDPSG